MASILVSTACVVNTCGHFLVDDTVKVGDSVSKGERTYSYRMGE